MPNIIDHTNTTGHRSTISSPFGFYKLVPCVCR